MNNYKRSSFKYINNKELNYYLTEKKKNKIESMVEQPHESVGSLLLDSSLISPTQYNYKIIECGEYLQVYKYNNLKTSKKDSKEKNSNLDKILKEIDIDYLYKKENLKNKNDLKTLSYKNIMRSKFQLQRIVKSNEKDFKTFITLTFAENVKDIEYANKKFDIWRTKIKSIKKDFKYVCVPEFQKRGAVHYHLLTNLEINKIYKYSRRNKDIEVKLIIPQIKFSEKQLLDMTTEQRKHCYDVKYWSYGMTSIYPLKNINVVGYITKYMTKDIDNRLWGKRKYLNSHNLKMPKEILLNGNNEREKANINIIEFLYDLKYKKTYYDVFGNEVEFVEYKV